MSRPLEPSEEYMLAAFLSGELPDHLRREIITYLNTHDQARDMLAMAQDAMEAVESGDGAARAVPPEARLSRSGGRRVWPQMVNEDKGHWKVTAFFAGAVLVLTITVAIMAFNTSRIQSVLQAPAWSPAISAEAVTMEWPAVPGAHSYHIMRFDTVLEEAAIIARTEENHLDLTNLERSAESTPVWVLAFGPDGELLDRSEPVRLFQSP